MTQQLLEKNSLLIEKIPVEGYELVVRLTDPETSLHAIIAIHDTTLGPALGGTRIYPYASEKEALEDVLRLSKGMTYKSSIVGVGCGGGKSIIIANPKTDKTPELLRSFGRGVESLQGLYICAEDVGCSTEDVKEIHKTTKYVVGLAHKKSSGDPSFFTAWGVFRGIQATIQEIFGSDSLEGKKVAIQGLGNVGGNLANYLFWAGAELILSDIDSEKLQSYVQRFGAKMVSEKEILSVECDILAPCAMGGILNEKTIPQLKCKAVAGGANNQLLKESDAELLHKKGILYAPDFIVNAGGLLNVAQEIEPEGYSPVISRNKVHQIYDTLLSIYDIAKKNNESTQRAALALAKYRVKYGIDKRTSSPIFHHSL